MEAVEGLQFLAGRGEEDRLASHRFDRQRRAAAGVTVELGHHHAVEIGRLGERFGDTDGVLAGHRVDDQQHVMRLRPLADLGQLVHQVRVDVEAPGGIDDQHVAVLFASAIERPRGDLDRVGVGPLLVDGGAGGLADGDQLIDRSGAVDVAGSKGDVLARIAEVAGELGAGGRLARSLQAGHQDHGRAAGSERQVAPSAAHQPGQLLVDDLDHLLARVEALQHLGAETALLQRLGEGFDDLEVDVGLEQGEADLAHRRIDVALVQLAARANVGERRLETI